MHIVNIVSPIMMLKKIFCLTEKNVKFLSRTAKKKGISVSELLRRIIDDYGEKEMSAKERRS